MLETFGRRAEETAARGGLAVRLAFLARECTGLVRAALAERRSPDGLAAIARDVRFAARSLLRTPGFTSVAVLTMALGIGANAAIFSAVDTVVFRSLAYPESERLVRVWPEHTTTKQIFEQLQEGLNEHGSLAMYSGWDFTLTDVTEPQYLSGAAVSSNYFEVLGVQPLLGRLFMPTVMSYAVGCRTRELGIRMALGATPTELVGSELARGMIPVVVGVVVGLLPAGKARISNRPGSLAPIGVISSAYSRLVPCGPCPFVTGCRLSCSLLWPRQSLAPCRRFRRARVSSAMTWR